jgi:hypothetical protein
MNWANIWLCLDQPSCKMDNGRWVDAIKRCDFGFYRFWFLLSTAVCFTASSREAESAIPILRLHTSMLYQQGRIVAQSFKEPSRAKSLHENAVNFREKSVTASDRLSSTPANCEMRTSESRRILIFRARFSGDGYCAIWISRPTKGICLRVLDPFRVGI